MIAIFLSLVVVAVVLLSAEFLWRKHRVSGELSRKYVHVVVGSFIATWPFYMPFEAVRILMIAMFAVVFVSRYLNLFTAIHAVARKTWGELFFPLSIGLITMLTTNPWIFWAAVMHLSLADGLAAIIGTKAQRASRYKLFGQNKSTVGTLAFFVVSMGILLVTVLIAPSGLSHVHVLGIFFLAALVSLIENISAFGFDDLLVPVTIAVGLQLL